MMVFAGFVLTGRGRGRVLCGNADRPGRQRDDTDEQREL
jgi:hypothetical protein